jgi:hypothetical protein
MHCAAKPSGTSEDKSIFSQFTIRETQKGLSQKYSQE